MISSCPGLKTVRKAMNANFLSEDGQDEFGVATYKLHNNDELTTSYGKVTTIFQNDLQ
jgi:hypothetical protein